MDYKNRKINDMLNNTKAFNSIYLKVPQQEKIRMMRNSTKQEAGERIVAGYWDSFINEAMAMLDSKVQFDFTYETIKNVPAILTALYEMQKKFYNKEKNDEIIAKTLACILYGLAMNEHGVGLKVTGIPKNTTKRTPFWADTLSIKLGIKKEVDFLEAALKGIKMPLVIDGGLYIDTSLLIKAYKSAMGVDLSEYGLGNIIIAGSGK